jgi:hypothetical protein
MRVCAWLVVLLALGCWPQARSAQVPNKDRPMRFALALAEDSTVLFAEDFEAGTGRWYPTAGTWTVAAEANGNHVYRQTNVTGDNWSYAGDPAWTDYAMEADIMPLTWGGTSRIVRIFGRWIDARNWYYVNLSSAGRLELRKYVNGAVTELASKPFPVTLGQWYRVRLEMIGTALSVYVAGALQLTATDATFSHGMIALGGYGNTAQFDNVAVYSAGTMPVPPAVATVTVAPPSASVTIGQTAQFSATLRASNGQILTGRAITWSSSNASVATVSGSGIASTFAAGTATITATSEGKSGSATLTVADVVVPPPGTAVLVAVQPASATIYVGMDTLRFQGAAVDAQGRIVSCGLSWNSSDISVATIGSATGKLVAHAPGSVTVTATCGAAKGTATVLVSSLATLVPGVQQFRFNGTIPLWTGIYGVSLTDSTGRVVGHATIYLTAP